MPDATDVAQLVLRTRSDGADRYLLARRTMDERWEFVGGKREPGESIREAALRELDEELASVSPDDAEILTVGDAYASPFGDQFMLHPVLVELPRASAEAVDEDDLSHEHDALAWIDLGEFGAYDTLGQRRALVELGLVEE